VIKIAPSILSADFGHLADQIQEAEQAGADYIHVDVMDGRFVPNLTMGPVVVEAVRRATRLPVDVHLMVEEPEHLLADFVHAGADILTVHQEACPHLHRVVWQIKDLGKRAGAALNPATPVATLEEIVGDLDLILVMTVNPGYSGQTFIESSVAKIQRAKELVRAKNARCEIEVDGGIDPTTAPKVVAAGANVLVAAAAVFRVDLSIGEALKHLRQAASD